MDCATNGPGELHTDAEPLSERELRALISEAVPAELGITPLSGFKIDLSANPGFHKVFFSARCECKTAALLSVEVSEEKSLQEVQQALPSLIGRLESQARSFYDMPCDMHKRMRMGPAKA